MSEKMPTPELDKLRSVLPQLQGIREFLEWLLYEQHVLLTEWKEQTGFVLRVETPQEWVALYFGIDMQKVERERQALAGRTQQNTAEGLEKL